jgi:hypothetical protein
MYIQEKNRNNDLTQRILDSKDQGTPIVNVQITDQEQSRSGGESKIIIVEIDD